MSIIDRRLNSKDKNIKNRQKFIQKGRDEIKKVVRDAIDSGNISDIENGKAKVRVKGISEPTFGIDHKTGNKKYVMPGNKEFVVGDKQDKPTGKEGTGGTEGGPGGRSEDDFEFELNQDEFLNFIFEDLELPDLVKKQMKDVTKVKPKRSGFTNEGNPAQLDVVRSLKNSFGRRIGLNRPTDEELEELERQSIEAKEHDNVELIINIEEQIAEAKRRQSAIPWLDPFDIRYRNFVPTPQPMTNAVMFCVMDISGSMGQREKDLSKRFFFFLYMFLKRKYQKVDIVFIMHHESAKEVEEHEFFNSKESGGTIVSTALKLTKEIIDKRYNVNDWNIYVAQASDGDNWAQDKSTCTDVINSLLPFVQYYAYVEISNLYNSSGGTDLWNTYINLSDEFKQLNMRKVKEITDIWKVFKDLFSKEKTK